MKKYMKHHNPNPISAGISFAIIRGLGIVILGIFGNFWSQYEMLVEFIGLFYIGYSVSLFGILIGLGRAIIDGFAGAFLIVRLYNVIYKLIKK